MRFGMLAAAALSAVGLGACALLDERAAAPAVPVPAPGPPRRAERDHAALLAAFGGEHRAPALQAVLDEAAGRLHAAGGRPGDPPAVTILDSPKVNAFALPSGRLYVTRGLLALANDPGEVAAVLAHETAHVARGHAAARTEREARSALLSRVAADLLNDPGGGAAERAQGRASLAVFSRAQELEADSAGIAYAAAAGYDPHAAARFLRALDRHAAFERRGAAPGAADPAGSHPASAERIAAAALVARRLAPEGDGGRAARATFLSALDGLPYGDRPADGVVRGTTFIHPRLGIAFTAPDGVALENTARAVLGASADGRTRLLLDAVAAPDGQALGETLAAGWRDRLEPGSARTAVVGGRPVAFASSRGEGWAFRLAAVRIGQTTFRVALAGRGASAEVERSLDAVLASLREVGPEEAAELRPQRVGLVEAAPGDTPEGLAKRMGPVDRPLDRFLLLNGLAGGAALRPGERYKIVAD